MSSFQQDGPMPANQVILAERRLLLQDESGSQKHQNWTALRKRAGSSVRDMSHTLEAATDLLASPGIRSDSHRIDSVILCCVARHGCDLANRYCKSSCTTTIRTRSRSKSTRISHHQVCCNSPDSPFPWNTTTLRKQLCSKSRVVLTSRISHS